MSLHFRSRRHEEPEINLIPFIDILLVVLIFLVLTTSYSRLTELKVQLPQADAPSIAPRPNEIVVTVTSDGRYAVNQTLIPDKGLSALMQALREAGRGLNQPLVIIHADAFSPHQAVVTVMDAARQSGLDRLSFASVAPSGR